MKKYCLLCCLKHFVFFFTHFHLLCARPPVYQHYEDTRRYFQRSVWLYVHRPSRNRRNRLLQYDFQYTPRLRRQQNTSVLSGVFFHTEYFFRPDLYPSAQHGVAGVAWATILSQLLSAIFSLLVGLKKYQILHIHRQDFCDLKFSLLWHLKTGFQMSVMCIGQLAMQAVVNSLGTSAVAGYTSASKADQVSVLVNNSRILSCVLQQRLDFLLFWDIFPFVLPVHSLGLAHAPCWFLVITGWLKINLKQIVCDGVLLLFCYMVQWDRIWRIKIYLSEK